MNRKKLIIEKLLEGVQRSIENINESLNAAQESRDDETKSSVGDKYETGRAMAQLEIEKLGEQLSQALAHRDVLNGLDIESTSEVVKSGSLVETNNGTYFLAIGFGKIDLGEEIVFVVSLSSPVGRALEGKSKGDKVQFLKQELLIVDIQ